MRRDITPVDVIEPGILDYRITTDLQRSFAAERTVDRIRDAIILLQHPAGRPPVAPTGLSSPTLWHGPGQLVGYPVIALSASTTAADFTAILEQVLIDACRAVGVDAAPIAGRNGLWTSPEGEAPRLIASVVANMSGRITQHTFTLNCDGTVDTSHQLIRGLTPGGGTPSETTSLSAAAGRHISVSFMQPIVKQLLLSALAGPRPRKGSTMAMGAGHTIGPGPSFAEPPLTDHSGRNHPTTRPAGPSPAGAATSHREEPLFRPRYAQAGASLGATHR